MAIWIREAPCRLGRVLGTWSMPAIPADADAILLADVLDLAEAALPSRLLGGSLYL